MTLAKNIAREFDHKKRAGCLGVHHIAEYYISVSEVPTAGFEDRLRSFFVGLSTEDVACTGASLLIDALSLLERERLLRLLSLLLTV